MKALRSAHAWAERLAAGETNPIANTYERRIIHLSCLYPEIQAAILAGEQPSGLTLQRLMTVDLPLDWGEQRVVLGRL